MSEQISQRELRTDSGRVMRSLDQGKTFVVTRAGQPVGELRPLRRHRFIDARAVVAAFANAPAIDTERFRADLDAAVDQDSTPRG